MENILADGVEGNIKYILKGLDDSIEITVENTVTLDKTVKIYDCVHRPIFGYDVDDIAAVDKILDDIINEMKEDG